MAALQRLNATVEPVVYQDDAHDAELLSLGSHPFAAIIRRELQEAARFD